MDGSTTALVVCGLYLAVSLAMGVIPGLRVSHSVTGFVAGDRSMSILVLYFVLGASIFSSFAFLGGPGWAYSRGAASFFILAYGTLGMVPFYFFGPRARRLGERYGFVTQAELLAHRFTSRSRSLSVVLAVVSMVVFIPYLTLQMKGAGYILSTVSNGAVSPQLGAAVTYLVVVAYVLASGVMGVGWTNTFQGLFMMVVAWGLGLYLPVHLHGGVEAMFRKLAASDHAALLQAPGLTGSGEPWDWWGYSSAIIVSAVGFSVWPHIFMKSFAARDDRTLRLTVVLYPTFQIFLVPILLIGFSGVLAFPGVAPADTILPYLLTRLELSPVLVGLVCAGTLAASMSSGDAILHAAASIGVRDGVARCKTGLGDEAQRFLIRIFVVALALVAYFFAVVSDVSIVALLLGSYGGVAQIFPLVFAAFYWPRATGPGALAGLVVGIVVSAVFQLLPQARPVPLHPGIFGLVANVLVFAVVSVRSRREPEDVVRAFVET